MKKIIIILLISLFLFSPLLPTKAVEISLTDEDKLMICKAVRSETENEPYLAKIALCATILNRPGDPGFPPTIHDIIIDKGAFPNFEKDEIQKLTKEDLHMEYQALDAVLSGIDPTCGAIFFMREEDFCPWEMHKSFRVGSLIFCKPKKVLK